MPTYVNARGEVQASRPLLAQARHLLTEVWLALVLLVSSLFNPTKNHKLKPSSSLERSRRINHWGPGGGGGGGGGSGGGGGRGPGGSASMSDFNGPTVSACQSSCGATY